MRAIVSNQLRRVRWFGVVFSLAAVGAVSASAIAGAGDHGLQAQQPVPAPSFPPIVFNGSVTINGETLEYTGFQITARIGDQWESPPVVVGADPENPFRYQHLVVAPPLDLDLIGSQIEFWLDGDVKSTVTNWYTVIDEFSGEVCTECLWSFPLLRQLDLDFPVLPNATPTTELAPDPTPTPFDDLEPPPIPQGFPNLVFRGAVTINGEPPAESSFEITARIGSAWESNPVRVRPLPQRPYGYSQLAIQPPLDPDLTGAEIEFWLERKVKAENTSVFAPYDPASGVYCAECPWTFPELRTLNLNFPHHPDQSPSPTPTPIPTVTVQRSVPQYPVLMFSGRVTVDGQEPTRSGFVVMARIRDVWQSHPVVVGSDPNEPFEYEYLIVAPDRELKLIGSHIEFWIANQVRSRTKSVFAFLPGESCDGCETYSTLPVLRQVDLDFPRLPDLTPTPSPTALPTSTNTPTPSPNPSATPTMTPTLTPVPPTQMPEPTNTPSPTPSPIPHTATPEPTSTFTSTPTAQPPTATATITPPPIPSPTSMPTPTSSPMTPTPYPTVVPTSTSTPTPTSVPAITTVTISPTIPTPATVESGARVNAFTGLAVTAILMVLAALGYIRWYLRRRSSIYSRSNSTKNILSSDGLNRSRKARHTRISSTRPKHHELTIRGQTAT